jgi:hypothetical protein
MGCKSHRQGIRWGIVWELVQSFDSNISGFCEKRNKKDSLAKDSIRELITNKRAERELPSKAKED